MSPSTINIAVMHGQAAEREALCDLIADEVGFRVVGECSELHEALELMRPGVHVLVIDLGTLPDASFEWIATARATCPATGILLLVREPPDQALEALLLRGATGYLEYARIAADISAALRTIGMGRRYQPPRELQGT
jgi:DNA-binding NarL/FixJ family response regulator